MSEKKLRKMGKFQLNAEIVDDGTAVDIFSDLEFVPLRVFKTSEAYYVFIGYSHLFEDVDVTDFLSGVPSYIVSMVVEDRGEGLRLKVEKI